MEMDSPIQLVEVGTLRTLPNEESQFIGSSTGIYFVNTVRRAFKASANNPDVGEHQEPIGTGSERADPVEGFIHDEDGPSRPASPARPKSVPTPTIPRGPSYDAAPPGLGRPPDAATARRLLVLYFKLWHPVFPFLHGPTFFEEVEALYDPSRSLQEDAVDPDRRRCCRVIIIQCVFNTVQAGTREPLLSPSSRIESAHSLLFSLSSLATRQDLYSLQALLAAQLYLVTSGSMRAASTVGGVLARSLFHSGLHRCPSRYPQLSEHGRDLRKRLFWCAYVFDRYLSQILGLPPGFQDSDIDVCMPGDEEQHVPAITPTRRRQTLKDHLPRRSSKAPSTPGTVTSDGHGSQKEARSQNEHRDSVLAGIVGYSKLTGRVVELFHKSVHVRSVDHTKISILSSDIDHWWYSLPEHLVSAERALNLQECPADEKVPSFVPLFKVLHQQLVLLINRPCLSLNPKSLEFKKSLQSCIQASRGIIDALEMQVRLKQPIFLPELLSAAWMAGLILAFACQVNFYSVTKAHMEIKTCLSILRSMSDHWKGAKHYYRTLDALFAHIHPSSSDRSTTGKRRRNDHENPSRKRPPSSSSHAGTHDIDANAQRYNIIAPASSAPPSNPETGLPVQPFHVPTTAATVNQHHQHQTLQHIQPIPEQQQPSFPSQNGLYHSFYDPAAAPQTSFLDAALLQQGGAQAPLQPGMPIFPESAENLDYFELPEQEALSRASWGAGGGVGAHATDGKGNAAEAGDVWNGLFGGGVGEEQQWMGDPSVNALDIFGQLTWGSLNGEFGGGGGGGVADFR